MKKYNKHPLNNNIVLALSTTHAKEIIRAWKNQGIELEVENFSYVTGNYYGLTDGCFESYNNCAVSIKQITLEELQAFKNHWSETNKFFDSLINRKELQKSITKHIMENNMTHDEAQYFLYQLKDAFGLDCTIAKINSSF